MFKNKNIKKFVSIVCITLTQQHIYPILQNSKLQAINFTVEKDAGEEYLAVTLTERLHCLIVQPQRTGEPDIQYQDNNSRLLLGVRSINNRSKVTRTTTGTQHLGEKIREMLSTSKQDDLVLLTLNPNDLNESNIPDLPYTQLRLPAKLTKSLTNEKLGKLITKYPTLKTTLNDHDYIPIVECQTSPNTEYQDKKLLWPLESQETIPPTPDQLCELVPQQLLTVGQLRDWMEDKNPEFWPPFASTPLAVPPAARIDTPTPPATITIDQRSDEKKEALTPTIIPATQQNLNQDGTADTNPPQTEINSHQILEAPKEIKPNNMPTLNLSLQQNAPGIVSQTTPTLNRGTQIGKHVPKLLTRRNPPTQKPHSDPANEVEKPTNRDTPQTTIIDINQHTNPPQKPTAPKPCQTIKDSSFTLSQNEVTNIGSLNLTLVTDLVDEADYKDEIIPTGTSTYYQNMGEPDSYYNKNELKTTIFSKTKKLIQNHPTTRVGLGVAALSLVGTIIYKLKKLFTRESKKSQANNQINQKYNQHVKNKI